jgi:hypothetical protein
MWFQGPPAGRGGKYPGKDPRQGKERAVWGAVAPKKGGRRVSGRQFELP